VGLKRTALSVFVIPDEPLWGSHGVQEGARNTLMVVSGTRKGGGGSRGSVLTATLRVPRIPFHGALAQRSEIELTWMRCQPQKFSANPLTGEIPLSESQTDKFCIFDGGSHYNKQLIIIMWKYENRRQLARVVDAKPLPIGAGTARDFFIGVGRCKSIRNSERSVFRVAHRGLNLLKS
jgi:hypothetical protein